jgi:hypothetical protein
MGRNTLWRKMRKYGIEVDEESRDGRSVLLPLHVPGNFFLTIK